MYTRKITPPPDAIIQNGKPVFGTFDAPFKLLEIRGIRHPYGNLPFPDFIINFRIRASLSFTFITEDYFGLIDIFDAKIFGYAEVVIWNLATAKKMVYRKILGPRSRIVPKSLEAATCISFSHKRYIRISWNRAQNRFSVVFSMKGNAVFPSISAAFTLDTKSPQFGQIASVVPAPITRRCSASYQLTAPLKGSFSVSGVQNDGNVQGIGAFSISRSYLNMRSKFDKLIGLGFVDNKQVTFKLAASSQDPVDKDTYNDNVLFIDGRIIPLPPVKITRPDGILGPWIIQDTESMVDLSFDPLSENQRKLSAFIVRTEYHTIFGAFDGMLCTDEGIALPIKDFKGIGKKVRLRF